MVNKWIREFEADHPPSSLNDHRESNFGPFRPDKNSAKSPPQPETRAIQQLCDMVGCNDKAVHRIIKCQTKTTSLSLADRFLQAIERPDATHNGEVRVIPNPSWTLERWLEWKRGCDSDND